MPVNNDSPIWQCIARWWEAPQLMEMREAWIHKQIQAIDEIAGTFPNGYVSKPEWRATIAEASFDNSTYRQCVISQSPENYWSVHQMRQTWAEEAMLFFSIGQPIDAAFNPDVHGEAMRRHQEERIDWRPHHRLPGEPSRQYSPVPREGLTHRWWACPSPMYPQLCRQRTISTLLAQNEALAQVFATDPNTGVAQVRDWLVGRQRFGWPLMRSDWRVKVSEEQDHFERGVFAMMRGYIGEVQLFTSRGFPIIQRYDPHEMSVLFEARGLREPYHSPYLTKGSPGW